MSSGSSAIIACPHCKKATLWDTQNFFRPFCSERCKLVDLGRWANEEFRIEQAPDLNDFLDSASHPSLTQ
jgi:uncharacterized protein